MIRCYLSLEILRYLSSQAHISVQLKLHNDIHYGYNNNIHTGFRNYGCITYGIEIGFLYYEQNREKKPTKAPSDLPYTIIN